MLKVEYSTRFKRDYKRMMKRGCREEDFRNVLSYLIKQESLPPKYRDHELTGNYKGFRECHINPDWLLVYEVREDELILVLVRTGIHSDLFN